MSLVALALLVGLVAAVGAFGFVVSRALALWRDAREFGRALGGELDRLADSVDRLSAFEPPDGERLSVAVGRLRASSERLSILTGALGRVQAQWAGLLAIYPKK